MAVACVVARRFEDASFRIPFDELTRAGVPVRVVGQRAGARLVGRHGREHVRVDVGIDDARVDDFDALYIPGGLSPDRLRADPRVVAFVRAFHRAGKPIAATCHGPKLLVTAGIVRGRKMTAWETVRSDLRAAGALVVDRAVVVDGNLITSRATEDLDELSEELLASVGVGPRAHVEDLISIQPSG